MKRLTIVYGDMTLFDADVAQLMWADSDAGVKVEAKTSAGGGGGLLDLLTGASKKTTQDLVESKRTAYGNDA